MRSVIAAALFTVSIAFATMAAAEQGTVVWVDPSCSYFIVNLGQQFGIYEWRAGSAPNEGDIIDGNLTAAGTVEEIQNTTRGPAFKGLLALAGPGACLVPMLTDLPEVCGPQDCLLRAGSSLTLAEPSGGP